jgi:ABC-type Fe3+-hydroxamate transport system substrate-binding protein
MGRIVLALAAGLATAAAAAVVRGESPVDRARPACAARIVSLSPHATEGLFALGAGATVVGVDDYSTEPPAARGLPRVGAYIDPDLEGLVALRPDLVVLAGTQRALAERLELLELPTLVAPDTRLDDVFATLELLGGAVCRPEPAAALSARLRGEIAAAAPRDGRRVKAVLVVDRPAGELRQFYVAGPDNFLGDLLTAAGAENVFGDAANPFPQVSLEPILAADPALVLELVPGVDAATAAERVALWRRVAPGLRAVRQGGVAALTEPWLPVPGPSVGRSVARLAELVAAARAAGEVGP